MAARPNPAQLLQPNARPGNASVRGAGGSSAAANGRGAARGRGGGSGAAATGSGDEGVSQQSRSIGDSTSITILAAVR